MTTAPKLYNSVISHFTSKGQPVAHTGRSAGTASHHVNFPPFSAIFCQCMPFSGSCTSQQCSVTLPIMIRARVLSQSRGGVWGRRVRAGLHCRRGSCSAWRGQRPRGTAHLAAWPPSPLVRSLVPPLPEGGGQHLWLTGNEPGGGRPRNAARCPPPGQAMRPHAEVGALQVRAARGGRGAGGYVRGVGLWDLEEVWTLKTEEGRGAMVVRAVARVSCAPRAGCCAVLCCAVLCCAVLCQPPASTTCRSKPRTQAQPARTPPRAGTPGNSPCAHAVQTRGGRGSTPPSPATTRPPPSARPLPSRAACSASSTRARCRHPATRPRPLPNPTRKRRQQARRASHARRVNKQFASTDHSDGGGVSIQAADARGTRPGIWRRHPDDCRRRAARWGVDVGGTAACGTGCDLADAGVGRRGGLRPRQPPQTRPPLEREPHRRDDLAQPSSAPRPRCTRGARRTWRVCVCARCLPCCSSPSFAAQPITTHHPRPPHTANVRRPGQRQRAASGGRSHALGPRSRRKPEQLVAQRARRAWEGQCSVARVCRAQHV